MLFIINHFTLALLIICLLCTIHFDRALHCAHLFARSLTDSLPSSWAYFKVWNFFFPAVLRTYLIAFMSKSPHSVLANWRHVCLRIAFSLLMSCKLRNKSQYWPCGAKKRVDTAENEKALRTDGATEWRSDDGRMDRRMDRPTYRGAS